MKPKELFINEDQNPEFLAAGDASIKKKKKKIYHKTVPENLCPGQFGHSRTYSSLSLQNLCRERGVR